MVTNKQGATKSIFRSNKTGKSRYTSIFNSVLQNEKLSLKERGLLVYLLSLDESWVINKTFLITKSEDGKDSVFTAFDGLVAKGYIKEIPRERQKDGKFKSVNYIVHEEPNLEFDENDYPDKNQALEDFQLKTQEFIEKSVQITGNPQIESSTIGFPASGKPDTGYPLVDNPHIESNILESTIKNLSLKLDSFISTFNNETPITNTAHVREPEKEVEVDCFALGDDLSEDFKPIGIEPSKEPFVKPEVPKKYKYPPFFPNTPLGVRNMFEVFADAGQEAMFENQYFEHIAWRDIKSDKGERPWNPDVIDIDFLNETCKGSTPVRKYLGVKAHIDGNYVKKSYHYVHLFNYDYLANPSLGPQLIKPIMDSATEYCWSYYQILSDLYEKKMANKERLRKIELNKGLSDDYEAVERY